MVFQVGTAVAILQEHDVGRVTDADAATTNHDVDLLFAGINRTFPEVELTELSATRVRSGYFSQGSYWITWKAHAKNGGLYYRAYAYEMRPDGGRGTKKSRVR